MTEGRLEDTNRPVRMITLPNGLQVGIQDLDRILEEVEKSCPGDDSSIQEVLLRRAGDSNYIADGAENQYGIALLRAYKKKYGNAEKLQPAPPKKKHAG